jgi:hypothetical protein
MTLLFENVLLNLAPKPCNSYGLAGNKSDLKIDIEFDIFLKDMQKAAS